MTKEGDWFFYFSWLHISPKNLYYCISRKKERGKKHRVFFCDYWINLEFWISYTLKILASYCHVVFFWILVESSLSNFFPCLLAFFIEHGAAESDICVHHFSSHSPESSASGASLEAEMSASHRPFADRSMKLIHVFYYPFFFKWPIIKCIVSVQQEKYSESDQQSQSKLLH